MQVSGSVDAQHYVPTRPVLILSPTPLIMAPLPCGLANAYTLICELTTVHE